MKSVLIYNSQASGDCLLGTHTARLYKQRFPDSKIYYCVRSGLTPTTAEGEDETASILEVLQHQEAIDKLGFVIHTPKGPMISLLDHSEMPQFDEVIEQHGWFSDLGIVRSQSYQLFNRHGREHFENTDTSFSVGQKKELPTDHLVIAFPGPLDWNRKTKNEALRLSFLTRLKYYLEQNNIRARITLLGRDVETGSLLESLQKLNNSHLFIGPIGLPLHAAAGLGVDTIAVSSVYPNSYDTPAEYHSGWHRAIKSHIHCGDYRCVTEKLYDKEITNTFEGPPTKWGFWPKKCPHTSNGFSCIYNTSPEQLVATVADWYLEKGQYLWTR
jgi:hypothetical protein